MTRYGATLSIVKFAAVLPSWHDSKGGDVFPEEEKDVVMDTGTI
jgi:hypothetical protein